MSLAMPGTLRHPPGPGQCLRANRLQPNAFQRSDRTSQAHITDPPLTPSTWPVMKPASGEHRKPTAAAMSSPEPIRPIGMSFAICSAEPSLPSACHWRDMGVSIEEGGMLLTVIPLGAYSLASDLVRVMTAPFAVA